MASGTADPEESLNTRGKRSITHSPTEAEIRVRLVGKATMNRGSAVIHFLAEEPGRRSRTAGRGFQVRLDGQGRLYLDASESMAKIDAVVPWMGRSPTLPSKKGASSIRSNSASSRTNLKSS